MILNIKRMQVVVWGGKDFLSVLVSLIAWWLNIQTRRYSDHFQLSDPPLSPNLPQCVKEVRAGVTPPHHCCFHNTPVAARRSRGLINPLIAPINPNTLELIGGSDKVPSRARRRHQSVSGSLQATGSDVRAASSWFSHLQAAVALQQISRRCLTSLTSRWDLSKHAADGDNKSWIMSLAGKLWSWRWAE